MNACNSWGHGTTNESEIGVFAYNFDSPSAFRFDIDRKIKEFRNGNATLQEVLDLIELYNEGN